MAYAVAEGAREAGAQADVMRVPELVPPEVAKASHFKLNQEAPVATIEQLTEYDAIVVGTARASVGCRRRWRTSSTGRRVVGARRAERKGRRRFTSTATQHGGNEGRCSRSSPTSCTSVW